MQNYIAALLSNITYLKTEDYTLNSDGKMIIFDIEKSGITSSELSFFNSNFSVEYQKNGTEGFSVMKIVALKTSDFLGIQEGQVTLAFRGTEAFLDDWITDLGMGMKALSDIVPKIINEGSQYIPGLIGILRNLGNLPIWNEYFTSQSQQALEYFNIEKNISANMTLVGHSLGGYLANYVTTTGDNYTYINETRTFNAPGFNASTLAIVEVRKNLESLINSDTSILTADKIYEIISEIDQLSFKIGSTPFNPDSFNKLNPFYSSTGLELTSNDLVMFMPESVNKIPMFTTPQINPTATHGIGFLMESSALYDTLNSIMTGSLIENYTKITKILENFEIHPLTIETLNTIGKYVSNFLGFSSQNLSDLFKYTSTLTSENLNKYIYNDISKLNYNSSSANLYALFNFIPFSISNVNDIFNNTTFDINKYTQNTIDERYNLFEKYQNLSTPTISNATLKNLNIHDTYKIIYEEDASSAYVIFDEFNKIILTNDSRSAAFSSELSDFSFYGDNFANIETIYLKNNQTALFVNTLNNKVYDTYLDDYIHLNKGSTTLDLSYGSDIVSIDVAAGASIKDLSVKDGGIGDLFIFNGGENSDFIQGTIYKDKIIGGDGDDALFGGDGDDIIDGGLGNDMIFGDNGDDTLIGGDGNDMLMGFGGSNSLNGGDGDDTLNAYNTPEEYHDIRGDILSGGYGFNKLLGTGYGDTYIYGNGIDTIYESDKHFGINYVDKLILTAETQSSELSLYNILNNLVIAINGINKVYVIDYYNNNYSYLDEIHFSNRITGDLIIWDTNYILKNTINKNDGSIQEIINGRSSDDNIQGTSNADYIDAGYGNDTIHGNGGNDTIHGNNGDDIIYGGDGNDIIYGGNGNDKIYSGDGFDIIYGDAGDDIFGSFEESLNNGLQNDTMTGGLGNDTIYLSRGSSIINYNLGDGNDTILLGNDDTNDIDKIVFGLGITSNNTNVTFINSNDVLLTFIDSGTMLLKNYATQSNFSKIDFFNFSDGVVWTSNDILNRPRLIEGTNGQDYIYDTIWNDIINAYDGADYIYSTGGSDIINAGAGDDFIKLTNTDGAIVNAGAGNDYIHINSNTFNTTASGGAGDDEFWVDGSSTLIMSGLNNGTDYVWAPNYTGNVNIRIDTSMKDMTLSNLKDSLGTITWGSNSAIKIELLDIYNHQYTFIFNDGETKNLSDIINKVEGDENDNNLKSSFGMDHITKIYGNGGNDYLTSNADNITYLDGGSGDDTLVNKYGFKLLMQGGSGNDTFHTYISNVTLNDSSGYDRAYVTTYQNYHNLKLTYSGDYVVVTDKIDGRSIEISKNIEEIILNSGMPGFTLQPYSGLVGNEINQVIELMAQYESDGLANMGLSDDPEIIKSYNEIRSKITTDIDNLWGLN